MTALPRLRVGMYTTVGERCGIAAYTRALSDALAAHVDVRTVPLSPGALSPLAVVRAAMRLNRGHVAHLQHTYSFFGVDPLTYTVLVRLLRAIVRAPLVLTAHTVRAPGPARYEGRLGSRLANALDGPAWHDVETFRMAARVLVHCELHRARLVARRVDGARCVVVPPGVPARVPVHPEAVGAFRARHGLEGRPVVGVFGFIDRSKRIVDVMDAVAALGRDGRAPGILLAGGARVPADDGVAGAIQRAAAARGLADRVVITGYLPSDEVPVALETMDVVIVPYATDDSVSYSVHVALAQRRAVVGTDVEPLRELHARGQCLVLVPTGSPAALAETLGALLDSERERGRLRAAAAAYAETMTVGRAAQRTAEVYATLRARAA